MLKRFIQKLRDISDKNKRYQEALMGGDDPWREKLTNEDYVICRQKGTERPFTGKYWKSKAEGRYVCKCCGEPLFDSDTKFDSGTGWPSFFQPVNDEVVAEHEDNSLGMRRVEVTCHKCGCHLGHVFDDGPAETTGKRYCVNSASLNFKPKE